MGGVCQSSVRVGLNWVGLAERWAGLVKGVYQLDSPHYRPTLDT